MLIYHNLFVLLLLVLRANTALQGGPITDALCESLPADVVTALDQGLSAPELEEQSFNCSSKQEASGEKGRGEEGVQWVQLRKERERGRGDKERESK